jgi:rare lipoprotein A
MESLTAAHRTLPLGTIVRVTNVANGHQTIVRINDRGPYVHGRILDLSHAAARQLHMVRDGVSPVYLEVVGYGQFSPDTPEPASLSRSTLTLLLYPGQLGAFRLTWPEARKPRGTRTIPDLIRERRTRRVADILAAEQRSDGAPTLALI